MEHYNYKGKEIVGIDQGFGNMKCRHVIFRSGVRAYDAEPPMTADALFYKGKYYVVGEDHKSFVSDKSQDEDYYILTIAALAKELEFRHITDCEVVLAVGLPIQWITAQKESFRKYLMKNEMIEFRYHGQDYLVRIDDVQVFPQGFAGIVQRAGDFKGLNVLADIGNGTMNTMYLKDGKPMTSRCYTDKLGVEQCIIRMSNELLAVSGYDMPYDVYEDFLRRGSADLPEKYTSVMQKAAEEYSLTILAKLREYEYNPEIMRLTVMGGGACILKHFWDGSNKRVQYIDDICATAKGYELLALNNLKRNAGS
jgi:plasmid segregation protein ParM